MPGYEQRQAELISSVELNAVLAQFSQSSTLILKKQLELLAAQIDQQKKKPSVFKSGSGCDVSFSYPIIGGGVAAQFYINAGVTTVAVLPIADADKVRITFQYLSQISDQVTSGLFYCLSTSDATNPIGAEQFGGLQATTSIFSDTLIGYVWDEIPCAGNKYIHLMGCIDAFDLMSNFVNGTFNADYQLNYSLIK